jgi:ribosomal protein S18 acetylase RimI-like enzyme
MNMEFREAEPGDTEGIRDVARASLHASYDDILGEETVDEAFEQWYGSPTLTDDVASDSLEFVVAENGDEVVGFAQVHRREEQDEGRIQWLHVPPDHRGEGIGERLLEHTRDVMHVRGIDRVTGVVLADNLSGNEFYREHGFVLYDQRTVNVGGRYVAENVYEDVAADPAEFEPVETPEGTLYVDFTDSDRGKLAPFYPIYRSEDGTRRYGWFCGNCETANNAMDAMGRIECNECGNVRKADRWDAGYL